MSGNIPKVEAFPQTGLLSFNGKDYTANEEGINLLTEAVMEFIPETATDEEVNSILESMGI